MATLAQPSLRAAWAIAGALAVIHIWTNGAYGHFRDELNYMICGERLDWGFVDHPPMIPALVQLCRTLFGDSLRSIRLVPALASAATVMLTALLARQLGGNRFAILLASVAVVIAPVYLSNGALLTTNTLEPVFWTLCAWCAVKAIQGDPRYWVGFGAALGLGLEEKYSIAIFGAALAVGLLLSRERRQFRSPWIWAGAALALLLFLPNALWNQAHGWPFLELTRNIRADGRDVILTPAEFGLQQILLMHPLTAPVWLTGLAALVFSTRFGRYRLLGLAYLLTLAFFLVSHGKNYYLAPAYAMLLAAGAVVIGDSLRNAWGRVAVITLLLIAGVQAAPLTMPVLAPPQALAYLQWLGIELPRTELSHNAALPQHFADQFGWRELADLAGKTWQALPEEDRRDCPFFGQNYGHAGAIDFFGRKYGMPAALSGHQTYYLWGPQGHSGRCLIVADDEREELEKLFEEVRYVGETNSPYALEGKIPLFVCRRPKFGTLAQLWPRLKKWR